MYRLICLTATKFDIDIYNLNYKYNLQTFISYYFVVKNNEGRGDLYIQIF